MKSNDSGRAFEAIVLEYIIIKLNTLNISASITEKAINLQENDRKNFNKIADLAKTDTKVAKLYSDYINNTPKLVDWMFNFFELKDADHITLEKFTDAEADINVADIQMIIAKQGRTIIHNISLKNNHAALKHSRIGPFPSWFGIDKKSAIYLEYKLALEKTKKLVLSEIDYVSKELGIEINLYSDLDKIESSTESYSTIYKNQYIYPKFYQVVMDFLNHFVTNKNDVNKLFTHFLSQPHFKVINKSKEHVFIVYDFENLSVPTRLDYYINTVNGYLEIAFNNGYIVNLRLHNDTSEISKSFNYKFDITLKNINELDIPAFLIKK